MKKTALISALIFIAAAFLMPVSFASLIKGLDKNIEARDIEIGGRDYVLLVDVCDANGISWEWDSISGRIILRKNGREAVLLVGSEYYTLDADIKKANDAVEIKNGSICIPLKFAKYTILHLFKMEKEKEAVIEKAVPQPKVEKIRKPSEKRFRVSKIVLDPGHGGRDPGAISRSGVKEKNIVLDEARRIKTALEREGVDVIMTRNSDIFVPLEMRARIANRSNADFFISVHANASKTRWARGFEVYCLSEATDDNARALAASENSALDYEEDTVDKHSKDIDAIIWDLQFTENREVSIELAGFICQEVSKTLGINECSIKSARFYVLKGAEMPSVLVELSYLSNRYDERHLNDSGYRQKLADGIASGVLGYSNEYERTNGFSE
ncbi:MAG: N-acetylmuramoyl-L-alanine amidase [Candidatus Omnitrophica bacterium]|nr:N-acetylmuramoyl-L-alanine amidase [Candidatus Omnitrophota bacterium]